jgi:hypothetical protein
MQLGVRYPRGPFAWLERIGRPRVVAMPEQLAREDPAFAPHAALFEPTPART